MSDNQDRAKSVHGQIVHRHLQRKFEKHRDKLEAHKAKGGHFRAAVEELEKKLFGAQTYQSDTEEHNDPAG